MDKEAKASVILANQEFFKSLPLRSSEDDLAHYMYEGCGLRVPISFVKASEGVKDAITGGCGPGGAGDRLVPDTMYGLKVTICCKIHDWTFQVWNDKESFDVSNSLFYNNLCSWIDNKSRWKWLAGLRKRRAYKYYLAVAKLGWSSYLDNHKEYIL